MATASDISAPQTARESVRLRPLGSGDLTEVRRLLVDLPVDYPGGDRWLERRLVDVLAGRADCDVAVSIGVTAGPRIRGLTIATPKSDAVKLSTIFVASDARRAGLGSQLLDSLVSRVGQDRELYVTVAHHKWPELRPLLESRGFTATAFEHDRYGVGRHEVVATRVPV